MESKKRTLIDLDFVLKSRTPRFYKWFPRFFVNYLKRLIRQQEINEIITAYPDAEGIDFVIKILKHLNVTVTYSGFENLDDNKKYVFASNHPLGGLDGLAVLQVVGSKYTGVKAFINDLLLNIEGLIPVFQGVDVFKRNTKEHLRQIDELYNGDKQVIVFPAGMVSRKINKIVQDMEWKKSFLSKAIQFKRDVIPVYVDGKNTNFFYNFAKFREFLGFKFNIELIFLPGEFFKYKNKNINIIFGKPIPWEFFDKSKSVDEWVLYVRNESYKLGQI